MAGNAKKRKTKAKQKKIKELSRDEIRRICAHFKELTKQEGEKRKWACCFRCPLCAYFDQDVWGIIDRACVKDLLNVKVDVPEEQTATPNPL